MVSLLYEFVCVELKEKRIEILFDTSNIAAHFLLYPYFLICLQMFQVNWGFTEHEKSRYLLGLFVNK